LKDIVGISYLNERLMPKDGGDRIGPTGSATLYGAEWFGAPAAAQRI
jgi:hypothetical protein